MSDRTTPARVSARVFLVFLALSVLSLTSCNSGSGGSGLPDNPPDPLPDGPVLSGESADSSAELSWADLTGAQNYKVYMSTSGPADKSSTLVSEFDATGDPMVTYTDPGLDNTMTYNYVVTAMIDGKESNVSNQFVANPFPQAVELVAGLNFTCALRGNGTIWCWGGNERGQLGDGTNIDRYSPVQEANLFTDWIDISSQSTHVCARRSGGTLYCWGSNSRYAVTRPENIDPTTISTRYPSGYVATPMQVDAASDWVDVSAGPNSTCGIKSSGYLYCWGGIVGATHTIQGNASNWVQAAAGGDSFCALNNESRIFCWGGNGKGQLGNGTMGGSNLTPTEETTTAGDWSSVAMGYSHVCGIRTSAGNSTLHCWGWNEHGQVGNAEISTSVNTPTLVGSGTDWASVKAGFSHSCASKTTGELFCWGFNSNNQLGEGARGDVSVPTLIGAAGATDWGTLIALGGSHSCATKNDKKVYCWGRNNVGQIGNGTNNPIKNVPTRVGTDTDWKEVETGMFHSCATKSDGTLWCTGNNRYGQLGTGDNNHTQVFQQVTAHTDWVDMTVGQDHSCGIRKVAPSNYAGSLWCWGKNLSGNLGNNSEIDSNAPVQEANGFTDWTEVSAGNSHTCALRMGGALYCWGSNLFYQVGNGSGGFSAPDVLVPIRVGGANTYFNIQAGSWATCANNGSLHCWGQGRTYDPTGFTRTTPRQVWSSSFGSSFAVGSHVVGYDGTQRAFRTWGANGYGQLGRGHLMDVSINLSQLYTSYWSFPAASNSGSCATRVFNANSSSLRCTGSNQYGQLGVGDFEDRTSFTTVDSNRTWKLSMGDYHTCGVVITNGELYCWGWNREGQHGSGDAWVSIGSLVEVTD